MFAAGYTRRMPFWGANDPPPPFWGHEPVPKVDADSAAQGVEKGALLIDVGTHDDWLVAHIPGALLVEPELFDMELERIPKDRPIVVAGRDQGLAEAIVASMRAKGYDAAVIDGGVSAWRASGRQLVRADGTPVR
jgi:rhodanese-related sulfurtransferase